MLRRIPDKFLILLFLAMNVLGLLGYFFGLDFYRVPSSDALLWIAIFDISFIVAWLIYWLSCPASLRGMEPFLARRLVSNRKLVLIDVVFVLCLIVVIIYSLVFSNGIVLFNILSGKALGDRPDVVGSLPFYWTFTVVLSSFALPLVVAHLVGAGHLSLKKVLLFLLLLFFSLILGDKSTLLSVIFFFLFFVGSVSIARISVFIVFFVMFYAIFKFVYHPQHGLDYFFQASVLFESIFRRVSMINVSAMGVVLDRLVFSGHEIGSGFSHLKQYVFFEIYGYLPGGAPVPFMVSSFYRMPLGLIPFLIFFISLFIFYFRAISIKISYGKVQVAIAYLNFYGAIVLVSGSLADYIIRSVVPIILFIITSKLVLVRFR